MAANWPDVLADPDVRRAVEAAARSCMQLACNREHRNQNGRPTNDPEFCDCPVNRMTPLEFFEFIEDEVRAATGKPVRFEPGHRPVSAPPLRAKHLNLAVAS